MKDAIEEAGGQFTLKSNPEVVGDHDDGLGILEKKDDDDSSESGDSDESEEQDETMGFELTEEYIAKQTGGTVEKVTVEKD